MQNIFTMDAATLLFAGVLVSLAITGIKMLVKKWGYETSTFGSMLIVAAVALIGAAVYVALVHFNYWDSFVKILVVAGAFYAYITKNVKEAANAPANSNEISEF